MKKFLITFSIAAVVVMATFFGYKGMVLAASRSEGSIPQSGDLCGGMVGKEIVSVGKNEFTIKRNEDGKDQIIHLANQATIKRSTTPASDLKIGERVVL